VNLIARIAARLLNDAHNKHAQAVMDHIDTVVQIHAHRGSLYHFQGPSVLMRSTSRLIGTHTILLRVYNSSESRKLRSSRQTYLCGASASGSPLRSRLCSIAGYASTARERERASSPHQDVADNLIKDISEEKYGLTLDCVRGRV
jgi:hypothetical protein